MQHSRYDVIEPPLADAQYGSMVSPPHSHRPFGLELPAHDPAVGVARKQATVAVDYANAVNLGRVAPEDVAGLGRWSRGHFSFLMAHGVQGKYCGT
jgi:hypothetical protein